MQTAIRSTSPDELHAIAAQARVGGKVGKGLAGHGTQLRHGQGDPLILAVQAGINGAILVRDEVEKSADRRFVQRLQGYFTKTSGGRYRSHGMVPSPFFVVSDMSYAVQAADLCIYCVNWGFRLPEQGLNAPVRSEIAESFAGWLERLQFRGEGYRDGRVFRTFGIFHVPDLFDSRK